MIGVSEMTTEYLKKFTDKQLIKARNNMQNDNYLVMVSDINLELLRRLTERNNKRLAVS